LNVSNASLHQYHEVYYLPDLSFLLVTHEIAYYQFGPFQLNCKLNDNLSSKKNKFWPKSTNISEDLDILENKNRYLLSN